MEECSICYENINDSSSAELCCGHRFHKLCLAKMINSKCPLCRTHFDVRKELNINRNARICKNSGKMDHYYSPFIKNGECRFCYGKPIEFFLSKTKLK